MSPVLPQSVYDIHTHECLEITLFGSLRKLAAVFASEKLIICATVNSTSKQMTQWLVFVHEGLRESREKEIVHLKFSYLQQAALTVWRTLAQVLSTATSVCRLYLCR